MTDTDTEAIIRDMQADREKLRRQLEDIKKQDKLRLGQALEDLIATGMDITNVCLEVGISKTTLYEARALYAREHPGFQTAAKAGRKPQTNNTEQAPDTSNEWIEYPDGTLGWPGVDQKFATWKELGKYLNDRDPGTLMVRKLALKFGNH